MTAFSSSIGAGYSCSRRTSAICGFGFLSSSALRSQWILPACSSTRVTALLSMLRSSSSTGSNRPVVNASTGLVAPRRRSIAFGVKTISGRRGRA